LCGCRSGAKGKCGAERGDTLARRERAGGRVTLTVVASEGCCAVVITKGETPGWFRPKSPRAKGVAGGEE